MGISARTAVAILRQYLDMLYDTGFLPVSVRSDHGTETPMMANAHWQLHRQINPDIPFSDVFWYGSSTLNQRIESWWRHLSKCQTILWKEMFDGMKESGEFTGSLYDQIALLYVYLPTIRRQIYHFVDLWNVHEIRKQKNKPYLPTGKPVVMYHCPGPEVKLYGENLDYELLDQLHADVSEWGQSIPSSLFYLPASNSSLRS